MRDQSDRPNEELNQQENESAAAEVLVNVLQNDKLSQKSATDSNLVATSPPSENHKHVKEGGDVVNLIKTRQQKPRRKKHRPMVMTEGKPRPRKQADAKPVDSKEKPTVKRKYVRKNASNKTSTTPIVEVTGEAIDQTIPEPAKRSSNFDMEGEHKDDSINGVPRTEQEPQDKAGGNQSKSVVHLSQGIEVIVNNTQCGIASDFDYPVSQLIQDYSSSAENQVAGTQMKVTDIPPESGHVYTFKPKHLMHIKSHTHSKLRPLLPKGPNCATFRTEQAAVDPKRMYIASIQRSNIFDTNSVGTNYNSLFAHNNGECCGQYQKRRTEKGQRATSTTTASFVQQNQHAEKPNTALDGKVPNSGHYTLNENSANSLPSWKDKSRKQKSSGQPTTVQNIASMADSAWVNTRAAHPAGQLSECCDAEQVGNSHGHQPFVKDLAEMMRYTFARKKKTKNQGSTVNFAPSCRIEEHPSGNILYKQDNFSSKTSGTQVEAAKKMLAVDRSAEESVHLH